MYNHRIHQPQDSVKGFFVSLDKIHSQLGADPRYKNNGNIKSIIKPKIKIQKGLTMKRFSMKSFGICNYIGTGLQSNSAGLIFLRSEKDLITTSGYKNPMRDPLEATRTVDGRYFLTNGYHRLVELARRGYTGWVYVLIKDCKFNDTLCPDKTYPCFKTPTISYVDEIL